AGRAAIASFVTNLSEADLNQIGRQYRRQPGEELDVWRRRMANEFMSRAHSLGGNLWQRFVEHGRVMLNRVAITSLTNEEIARALARRVERRNRHERKVMRTTTAGKQPISGTPQPAPGQPAAPPGQPGAPPAATEATHGPAAVRQRIQTLLQGLGNSARDRLARFWLQTALNDQSFQFGRPQLPPNPTMQQAAAAFST